MQSIVLLCVLLYGLQVAAHASTLALLERSLLEMQRSSNTTTLAVVRPFVEKDMQLLLQPILEQRVGWDAVCSPSMHTNVDLIFYYNRDFADVSAAQKRKMEQVTQLSTLGSCFSNIHVLSAMLTPQEDGYPQGCCRQYMKLFLDSGIRDTLSRYHYIFYMEPDVYPLQSHWLDHVVHAAHTAASMDLWVYGPKFDASFVPAEYTSLPVYSDGHLNGNAIYAFGNAEYLEFLVDAYHNAMNQCEEGDYDEQVWQYVHLTKNRRLLKHFQASDLVAHCKSGLPFDPVLQLDEARGRYPTATLIHALPLLP